MSNKFGKKRTLSQKYFAKLLCFTQDQCFDVGSGITKNLDLARIRIHPKRLDPDSKHRSNKIVNFLDWLSFLLILYTSVADPGCLSRIPDPDFYPSRIPDPGSRIPDPKTATKERGEKKFDVIPFHVATNFAKLYIILVLKC
jgi:hypothetical protein